MAGSIKLQAGAAVAALTDASSIANGATFDMGTIDNTAALADQLDFGLAVAFGSAPTPGTGIVFALYAVPWANGANAPSVNTTGPVISSSSFVGNFEVALNQTAVQYLVTAPLIPGVLKYEIYLTNLTGQATAGTTTLTVTSTQNQYT